MERENSKVMKRWAHTVREVESNGRGNIRGGASWLRAQTSKEAAPALGIHTSQMAWGSAKALRQETAWSVLGTGRPTWLTQRETSRYLVSDLMLQSQETPNFNTNSAPSLTVHRKQVIHAFQCSVCPFGKQEYKHYACGYDDVSRGKNVLYTVADT